MVRRNLLMSPLLLVFLVVICLVSIEPISGFASSKTAIFPKSMRGTWYSYDASYGKLYRTRIYKNYFISHDYHPLPYTPANSKRYAYDGKKIGSWYYFTTEKNAYDSYLSSSVWRVVNRKINGRKIKCIENQWTPGDLSALGYMTKTVIRKNLDANPKPRKNTFSKWHSGLPTWLIGAWDSYAIHTLDGKPSVFYTEKYAKNGRYLKYRIIDGSFYQLKYGKGKDSYEIIQKISATKYVSRTQGIGFDGITTDPSLIMKSVYDRTDVYIKR